MVKAFDESTSRRNGDMFHAARGLNLVHFLAHWMIIDERKLQ